MISEHMNYISTEVHVLISIQERSALPEEVHQKYIYDYFEEHRMKSMAGFLGFGEMEVPLKTSPAWCPRKKGKG